MSRSQARRNAYASASESSSSHRELFQPTAIRDIKFLRVIFHSRDSLDSKIDSFDKQNRLSIVRHLLRPAAHLLLSKMVFLVFAALARRLSRVVPCFRTSIRLFFTLTARMDIISRFADRHHAAQTHILRLSPFIFWSRRWSCSSCRSRSTLSASNALCPNTHLALRGINSAVGLCRPCLSTCDKIGPVRHYSCASDGAQEKKQGRHQFPSPSAEIDGL